MFYPHIDVCPSAESNQLRPVCFFQERFLPSSLCKTNTCCILFVFLFSNSPFLTHNFLCLHIYNTYSYSDFFFLFSLSHFLSRYILCMPLCCVCSYRLMCECRVLFSRREQKTKRIHTHKSFRPADPRYVFCFAGIFTCVILLSVVVVLTIPCSSSCITVSLYVHHAHHV